MRCSRLVESCGSRLFLSALTATISTTSASQLWGQSKPATRGNGRAPQIPICLSLRTVQNFAGHSSSLLLTVKTLESGSDLDSDAATDISEKTSGLFTDRIIAGHSLHRDANASILSPPIGQVWCLVNRNGGTRASKACFGLPDVLCQLELAQPKIDAAGFLIPSGILVFNEHDA